MTEEKKSKRFSIKGIGLTTLGWEIALPIFGGVLIGHYLDQLTENTYMFTLSFLGLGIFIAYYNIYKRIQIEIWRKNLKDKERGENKEELKK
ncbi:MAG TPA: AtpZ/AtpI family protein [Brevefilum sp.]|nr:AtpZ/AtpI family protein [Brevefilum sp.]